MKKPWENPAFTWWPSWVGTDPRFPAVSAQPVEEAWRVPGPTISAPASATPSRPISPTPTEGGLLSSLGPGTGDGLLGRLALPVENLDSGRYGGDALAPPITRVSLISAGDDYRPVPGATRGQPFPAPPSGSPLNVSVSIPEQTSGGDETPGVSEVLSDLTPDNYWIPGADYAADGHHHNPRGVYRKLPLPEETRKVFDKATTGSLPFYKWHEYDELHRMYNDAVEELMSRFMKEHGIKAEQMTPDHARAVLKAIAESNEPRIRVYRSMLQLMGRLYRLRSGARGNE